MNAQDKKELILKSTLVLVKRHGLSHTTMDMIAGEAGVSKKTLYALFSSKDLLLMQALELEVREVKETLRMIQAKNLSASECWCQILHAFAYRMYAYSPVLVKELSQCMPLIAWSDAQKTQLAELISESPDSIVDKQKVEVLLRSFLGILSRSMTQSTFKLPITELENTVIPFYCRGV